LRKAR
jgi:hypothetical protein